MTRIVAIAGWSVYVLVALLWATFAIRMQAKLRYSKRLYNPLWVVWLVNFIGAPIAMVIAVIRVPVEDRSQEGKEEKDE
jgi:hypothetical protein